MILFYFILSFVNVLIKCFALKPFVSFFGWSNYFIQQSIIVYNKDFNHVTSCCVMV